MVSVTTEINIGNPSGLEDSSNWVYFTADALDFEFVVLSIRLNGTHRYTNLPSQESSSIGSSQPGIPSTTFNPSLLKH
jgi:hypothetical protein